MSDIVDFSFYPVENLAQAWAVVGDGSRPAARTEGKHTCIPRKKKAKQEQNDHKSVTVIESEKSRQPIHPGAHNRRKG